jgi:hypothetical protein
VLRGLPQLFTMTLIYTDDHAQSITSPFTYKGERFGAIVAGDQ